MNVSQHIEDLAELYALGSLDDAAMAQVDAHARECPPCAARLGEAESTVAAMIEQRTPSPALDRRMHARFAAAARPRWMRTLPAIAAAFLIGFLPALGLWLGERRETANFDADRQTAVAALVSSHFLHAPFTPSAPDAPKAKIIYARTGSWIYVVAQTNKRLTVAQVNDGMTVPLGALYVSGNAGELFVAQAAASRTFELLDGARVVARVQITRPYRR